MDSFELQLLRLLRKERERLIAERVGLKANTEGVSAQGEILGGLKVIEKVFNLLKKYDG